MCGICGIWKQSKLGFESVIKSMTASLSHRGPDSSGIWISKNDGVALGHTRLAIIDLSDQGNQPIESESGRYVMVFNGEIYNHIDIRSSFGTDKSWRGHSDSETLIESIDKYGLITALRQSVGMFAILVWDRHNRTLSVARDRLGEKPLYYFKSRHEIGFASELKALKKIPDFDSSIDVESLKQFINFGYIPSPHSAFRAVKKIEPGTVLTFRSPTDDGTAENYWSLHEKILASSTNSNLKIGGGDYLNELESLLERSIREQMAVDVPFGGFLSGGIDSSLIVSLMQRLSSKKIRTFSIGVSDQLHDESKHARLVADHLGTDHTDLIATPKEVLQIIPKLATIYDEPFADSSQVPIVMLTKLAKQNVTVALSGDAGDELFGGYNRHITAKKLDPLFNYLPHNIREIIAILIRLIPISCWDNIESFCEKSKLLNAPPLLGEKIVRLSRFVESIDGREAYLSAISQWADKDKIPTTYNKSAPTLAWMPDFELSQQMMCWDMTCYLPDDILVKVDRAAMAVGLETRIPFLDYRVVEFALNLPSNFKIKDGKSKWLLRQILNKYVPSEIYDRPKRGFTLPIADWLRGPLRDWAEELLSANHLDETGLLNVEAVKKLWNEHQSRKANHQRGLWTVLMLQSWFLSRK